MYTSVVHACRVPKTQTSNVEDQEKEREILALKAQVCCRMYIRICADKSLMQLVLTHARFTLVDIYMI
jgi:hypothetical protein